MLSHPNIVPMYDSGELEGHLFYVMPYIEGESLRQRLDRETMLPVDQVLDWANEVAQGLAFAHHQGIVHRDIKPENLLLQSGRVLIADFGIARAIDLAADEGLTSEQFVVGTPIYMSPEQAGGGKIDGRTDIYSLACVIYELLAGEPPFRGATVQSTIAKKLSGTHPSVRIIRPTVSREVSKALDRALSPISADRFARVEEFAAALRQRHTQIPALNRRWLTGLGLSAIALALAVGLKARSETRIPVRQRVVVGLFENRTGSDHDDPIGFMAADWITEGLQRTGSVDVVPTLTAVAASHYVRESADTVDPVKALARETGAELVVTGAIYRTHDSLVVQAQLADPRAGRLIGAIEPLRVDESDYGESLQQLRARLMGLLALSLDERVVQTDRPPTYAAYQSFSEGVTAYARNDYSPALSAFGRAYASDSTFVLPLLYASFCLTNRREYQQADSVLQLVSKQRERLNEYHRDWLDYQLAELAGDEIGALSAIRRAAQLAPGSKATYNFAATAFEAGQPFPAESALRLLPPDTGPMRGWLPYWDLLTAALHAQDKSRLELAAAHDARMRFPDRVGGYVPEARALASQKRSTDVEALWQVMREKTHATDIETADLALDIGDELKSHGDSAVSFFWFRRAYAQYSSSDSAQRTEVSRWGRARAAARMGQWAEALELGEALLADSPAVLQYRGFAGVAAARLGKRARAAELMHNLAENRQPYTLGHPQYEAARVAAALGLLEQGNALLVSAYSRGYPYDIDFHRDPVLRVLSGHRVYPK